MCSRGRVGPMAKPLPFDLHELNDEGQIIMALMDHGLTDDEICALLEREGIGEDVASARHKWNGEGQRQRAHAKTAEAPPNPNTNAPHDGAALLDQVHAFLGRFVAYPSEHAHVAHTLWVAHTH